MKLEMVSREVIRPSFPTPQHLRVYNLSFFDQFIPSMFVPVLLFYSHDDHHRTRTDRLNHLKKSLSETLVHYYPHAGRIRDKESIDCNEGAVVLEASMECELSEILEHPKNEILEQLLPDNLQWTISADIKIPLFVQITFFSCGGMAIGLCMSHKVLDMSSMSIFIKDWAAIACGDSGENVSPDFSTAAMFPRGDIPINDSKLPPGAFVTKRFVFDASKIVSLKSIVSKNLQNPTRVEVVSALIYKCAISASRANSNLIKPGLFIQALNLRARMVPPLPENFVGNLAFVFTALTMEESEIMLHGVVSQTREELVKFCDRHVKKFRGKEWFSSISECLKDAMKVFSNRNLDAYRFTSWCWFPLYHGDFGWGKPIWITTTSNQVKNSVLLMDTRNGDGIEALVTLENQVMDVFEGDEELLEFVSCNPSALV